MGFYKGFYKLLGMTELSGRKAEILRQRNRGLQPELCFTIRMVDVNVHPGFLTGKEEPPKCAVFDDRWSHARMVSYGPEKDQPKIGGVAPISCLSSPFDLRPGRSPAARDQ